MSMVTETSVSFGAFRLDPQNACVWRGEKMIKLTPKAFAVLHYLVSHPGRLVTKDELFTAVWPKTVVSDVALSVCVRELRKNLEDDAKTPLYIETVHRQGFRFIGKAVGNQLSVVSQAEVASSQYSVASSQEKESRKAREGNDLESSVQGLASETSDDFLQNDQTLDIRHQTLNDTRPVRSWPRRNLAWLGIVLLASAGVFLFYFFSSRIPQSEIRNQGEATSPLPLPDKPSIIVLPFVNLSGDPTQEYFSDGVTEEITATLSRVSGLFVIARTSAFTYKGKAAKVQDISREMGVRYVLEGSVQKADGQVRIIAQLIDATTGKHLWSEHYDRPLQNIFALQDEIREKITLALQVRLALEESGQAQRAPTTNLDAYDFYLRGLEAAFRAVYKNDPLILARQLYESAIALDSQYAEAYARVGETYLLDWFFNPSSNQGQSLERALAMAQRAVALNDALPLPHAIVGRVFSWKRQYEQALVEARRAVTLDPNFAEGYFHLGNVLFLTGPPEESVKANEQAIRLNPKPPDAYFFLLAASYRIAGRYQEALTVGKQFAARHPDFHPIHFHLAVCYAEMGQLENARAAGAEMLRLNPTFTLASFERFWPVKDPAMMERTLAALRKAGLK
jgi:TolB-like protein/DNA-binding winged helix-turn-helix (wHTH) protein